MFGYACNETPELMPLSASLSHKLVQRLASIRKRGELWYLRPDSKSQVTVEYENGKVKRVDAVVISTQHHPDVGLETIRRDMIEKVIKPICHDYLDDNTKFFVNPTGKFVIGGPVGDAGLTGRKIIVDTYGGHADPVSVLVETFGTEKIPNEKIVELVKQNFNFKPKAMIDELNLKRPIYQKTAAYGHFGREDPDFTWEKTDKVELLKQWKLVGKNA